MRHGVASPWEINVNSRFEKGEIRGGNLGGKQDLGRIKGSSAVERFKGYINESKINFSEKNEIFLNSMNPQSHALQHGVRSLLLFHIGVYCGTQLYALRYVVR